MPASELAIVIALGEAIARRIGGPRFQLWFESRTRFQLDDEKLIIGVPTRFYQEYLESTFRQAVSEAAKEITGRNVPVRFVIDPELFQAARREQEEVQKEGQLEATKPASLIHSVPSVQTEGSVSPDSTSKAARRQSRKRRWRSLADFVVGTCNRVAYASALAVVENPGMDVNPLVLHGPVGTGKTHLLEGIYVGLRKAQPQWRILFVTAEEFTNRFLVALRTGKLTSFRRYFRECDALLLDDVHFLAGKQATEEEFLHTFNALHADGRQVVLTSDCHPRLCDRFMPELVDRLLGGAAWAVMPPDYDTRLQLLRLKSQRKGQPPLNHAILEFLAEQLRGNVRELEGALNTLFHFSRVAEKPITLALAREALADLLRHSVRILGLTDIDEAVRSVFQLERGSLQTKQRSWAMSHPRMLAMYLARKHTTATHTEIGKYFGHHAHSTVVAAEKRVRQWLQKDETLPVRERQTRVRELIERIERQLHS